MSVSHRPSNLRELRASGWQSRTVKEEIRGNFLRMLRDGAELFPGILGYDHTVIPEINLALIAGHDMLFLGEKGQAKSRLMRMLVRFLDDAIPYIADPSLPVHEDPYAPITGAVHCSPRVMGGSRRSRASREPVRSTASVAAS